MMARVAPLVVVAALAASCAEQERDSRAQLWTIYRNVASAYAEKDPTPRSEALTRVYNPRMRRLEIDELVEKVAVQRGEYRRAVLEGLNGVTEEAFKKHVRIAEDGTTSRTDFKVHLDPPEVIDTARFRSAPTKELEPSFLERATLETLKRETAADGGALTVLIRFECQFLADARCWHLKRFDAAVYASKRR